MEPLDVNAPEALMLPPHSIEAEQAVLGALLLEPHSWPRVAEIVTEGDFYSSQNRVVFRALAPLAADGRADVVMVGEALRRAGNLEAAGGLSYVHQLAETVPSTANIAHHARIVAERARRREIASAALALADSAMLPNGADAVELLIEARKRVEDIETKVELGAASRMRTPHVWLDQAELSACGDWLVKGLIGARDLVLVYGPTSCGKTFWTIDLAASIAAGIPWRGRRTRRALVVYVAAEAGQTIMRRFIAWRDRNLGDARDGAVPLAIIPRGFNLLDPMSLASLLRHFRDLASEVGASIGLVVIDTLSRSMPGGDENSAADMTKVIAAADRIREELGAAVLLIHHSGKDAAKGARGHSALVSAADTIVAVADRVASGEKVRDGRLAGASFPFALEVVELGLDEDREPITTCVAVASDEPPRSLGAGANDDDAPRPIGLGGNQEKALSILRKLLAQQRKVVEERGDDASSTSVLTSGWQAECQRRGIDRRRWAEVRKGLEDRGLVRIEGPHAVPIGGQQ